MVPSSLLFECSLPLHLRIIRVGRPHVALIRRVLKSVAVKVLHLPCWKMPLCPRMMLSSTHVVCNGRSPRSIRAFQLGT